MPRETDWLVEPAEPKHAIATPEPKTVPTDQGRIAPQTPRESSPGWFGVVVAVLVTIIAMRAVERINWPINDDQTDGEVVDIDRPHVLILVDPDKMNEGQASAAGWSGIVALTKDRGIAYREADADDDLSKVEPEFQAMRAKAAAAPSLTIAADGKLRTGPLPNGIEELKQTIESIE